MCMADDDSAVTSYLSLGGNRVPVTWNRTHIRGVITVTIPKQWKK
jgi:hypothetical protein